MDRHSAQLLNTMSQRGIKIHCQGIKSPEVLANIHQTRTDCLSGEISSHYLSEEQIFWRNK